MNERQPAEYVAPTRLRPVLHEYGRVTDETLDRMCRTGSCWPSWVIKNMARELLDRRHSDGSECG